MSVVFWVSENKKITVKPYKNLRYVDIRKQFLDDDRTWQPTKAGITLNEEEWEASIEIMEDSDPPTEIFMPVPLETATVNGSQPTNAPVNLTSPSHVNSGFNLTSSPVEVNIPLKFRKQK